MYLFLRLNSNILGRNQKIPQIFSEEVQHVYNKIKFPK